jgi:hypothetical protein
MNNNIELVFLNSPQSFTLNGPTFLCDNTPTALSLSGSELGVQYNLNNDAGFTGQSLVGTGSPLEFTVSSPGQYSVIATNADGCTVIAGFISIQGPSAIAFFEVIGGGEICPSDAGLPILLSGSELQVSYSLYLNGTLLNGPIAGTGNGLVL